MPERPALLLSANLQKDDIFAFSFCRVQTALPDYFRPRPRKKVLAKKLFAALPPGRREEWLESGTVNGGLLEAAFHSIFR